MGSAHDYSGRVCGWYQNMGTAIQPTGKASVHLLTDRLGRRNEMNMFEVCRR